MLPLLSVAIPALAQGSKLRSQIDEGEITSAITMLVVA